MEFSISIVLRAVYLIFLAFFLAKSIKWLLNYYKKIKMLNNVKSLPIIPFIGNLHQLKSRKERLYQFRDTSLKFKDEPIWCFWLAWRSNIVFHKADHLEVLFSSAKHTEKSEHYDFLHPWLGFGLLTSYGEKWQTRRRLITPTFHFDILKDFLNIMNEQGEIFTDVLSNLVKKNNEVDIFERIKACALDIICETAMGKNVNAQTDRTSEYVYAIEKICELLLERMSNPFQWADFIFDRLPSGKEHKRCLNILHSFTRKVILERDSDFESLNLSSQKRIAFLDVLLKAKHEDPTITYDDIREEVDTFMFEGHDTTTAAASWACQLIGSHPEVQKKLHKEIDEVFGQSLRHITNDDLNNLKYLECVIKESLRLFPSVPFYGRKISENATVANYPLIEGENAVILAYMIHRDEKYYPDPEKFDPDRFLPENSKDRHPFAYVPFSAGRRNCIGQRFALMEEKVILTSILRKFEIESVKKLEEIEIIGELIIRPLQGIPIRLKSKSV